MNNSRLKIKYGMIEFEIESDPETIEKERKAFLETLPTISVLSNNKPVYEAEKVELIDEPRMKALPSQTPNITTNLNTFLQEKGFSSDIDKCLGVIYFMNNVENEESVSNQTIKARMQKSKLSIPKSLSVALNGLTTKGYIQLFDKDGNKGMNYYITPEGIQYIEAYEKKEKKVKTIKRNKSLKRTSENRYDSLTKEIMCLDDYPAFSKLKTSKEKIMLLMYIMKKRDLGEYFTVSEIKSVISQIFNERLSDDAIKGVFKNRSTAKYFDKKKLENNNKVFEYKMLQNGFDYFEDAIINK
ncbi:MAG: hypothetical protein IJN90_01470 [Bacilli bacterium]|nr:hypothetical protein [Bacilli bacterium]